MNLWHPWRWLRERHPGVVVLHEPLPAGRMGQLSSAEIRLHDCLTQAERRCTLTHELIHLERRGAEHPSPAVEEQIVEAETARRLVTHGDNDLVVVLPAFAAAALKRQRRRGVARQSDLPA